MAKCTKISSGVCREGWVWKVETPTEDIAVWQCLVSYSLMRIGRCMLMHRRTFGSSRAPMPSRLDKDFGMGLVCLFQLPVVRLSTVGRRAFPLAGWCMHVYACTNLLTLPPLRLCWHLSNDENALIPSFLA